jgi:hypothetical protein
MIKYFIVCENEYEDGSFYEVLTDYDMNTETSRWDVNDDSSSSVMSFLDYYIKDSEGYEPPPQLFNSEKEAKEVLNIIKAHDEPNITRQKIKEIIYYIVCSKFKIVPQELVRFIEA